jgi:tetratricopeptide (TPR) repeat protein
VKFLHILFVVLLWSSAIAFSQAAPALSPYDSAQTQKTILITPFENLSKAPGIEWIGESFPEVLGQRLGSDSWQVMRRSERLSAFDRAGVPAGQHPSRATIFRIAEQLDADYVVLGSYTFDGRTFSASCQWLHVKRAHLSKEMTESGPLPQLINLQTGLAWDILRLNDPALAISRDNFVAAAPPIRLDALENYTRGVLALSSAEKIKYFREAARINPLYFEAQLALGQAYFDAKQYEPAAAALAKVPPTQPLGGQAQFLLGLCEFYLGQFEKAETAFTELAARVPLPEVYNNLGVAQSRRGRPAAVDQFQRANDTDPGDADYSLNLAIALYRKGDLAGATRSLRETLASSPEDGEARSLLESVIAASDPQFAANSQPTKTPLERIKRQYDEDAFRQIAAQLQRTLAAKLAEKAQRLPKP